MQFLPHAQEAPDEEGTVTKQQRLLVLAVSSDGYLPSPVRAVGPQAGWLFCPALPCPALSS